MFVFCVIKKILEYLLIELKSVFFYIYYKKIRACKLKLIKNKNMTKGKESKGVLFLKFYV